jgi:hypothetical protein
MEEDKILITISNLITKSLLCDFRDKYMPITAENIIANSIEVLKILPFYPLLTLIMYYVFLPLKPVLYNLDKNVSFLNICENKYTITLVIGCDWCSICNGIMETAKQNIIKKPTLLKLIDFEKLKYFDTYLDFVLINRQKKLNDKQIKKWCENTFKKNTPDLLLLSRIYLKLELLELRWCPFKRSKKMYYRNKDKLFLEPTDKIICEVGKILSKKETITCNDCPKLVNENWKYTKSNKNSIFQPLLDHMMSEINKL